MSDWLIPVGWVICGFIAYGTCKGSFVNVAKKYPNSDEYNASGEFLCIVAFLMGYMGLVLIFVMEIFVERRLFWCLRAPKETTKKFWDTPDLF